MVYVLFSDADRVLLPQASSCARMTGMLLMMLFIDFSPPSSWI